MELRLSLVYHNPIFDCLEICSLIWRQFFLSLMVEKRCPENNDLEEDDEEHVDDEFEE